MSELSPHKAALQRAERNGLRLERYRIHESLWDAFGEPIEKATKWSYLSDSQCRIHPDDAEAFARLKLLPEGWRFVQIGESIPPDALAWMGERGWRPYYHSAIGSLTATAFGGFVTERPFPGEEPAEEPEQEVQPVPDAVEHPPHYTKHPSGVECIEITKHMNFCRGNAVKYIWRAGAKDPAKEVEDLRKAVFYLTAEIARLEGGAQ